jgi:hypothetical protein
MKRQTNSVATQDSLEVDNLEKLIEDQTTEIAKLNEECRVWKAKAKHYGERFSLALKGHLIVQGLTEEQAESERQKVLSDVSA